MHYLVRHNPTASHSPNQLGFSIQDGERAYERVTGRSADKDLKRVKGAAAPMVTGEIQKLATNLQKRAQFFAETEATNIVNTLINEIPNEQEMIALGDEIGIKIRNAIQDNVLPLIYKRVDEAVTSAQGLGVVSESKRLEIYSKITSSLPKTKTIDIQGIKFTINIGVIFQKALPFEKFSRVFDRANPLINSVREQAETAAIEAGKNIGAFVAINSFILGGLVTYGFIKLYNSTK